MARRISQHELRSYVQDWLDTNFTNGLINRNIRQATLDAVRSNLPELVLQINRLGRAVLNFERSLTIVPRTGMDPRTGNFTLFEFRFSGLRRLRRLCCFLGHRYRSPITKALRLDLRFVLEPSNIKLVWSDMDLSATGFFETTVRQIRRADFCIFDNREADLKPNVYIEAGIAYVLRKPFIIADYQGNRLGVPSDLRHINRIPYRDYEELSRQIYFRLPIFLRDNGFRTYR